MRSLVATLMMLLVGQSAFADNRLYIEDFTLAYDETQKEISVILDNDDEVTQFQLDILMPMGLVIDQATVKKVSSRLPGRGVSISVNTVENGKVRIAKTGGTEPVAPGIGAVITFTVKSTLSVGEYVIKLSNIVISNIDAQNIASEAQNTTKVTSLASPVPSDCFFGTTVENLGVAVGKETQVDITLTNTGVTNLAAFSGTLTLPEGLTLVPGSDGKFIYTDRLPEPLEFQFVEVGGALNFLLSSTSNTLITGEEGVIFSFLVKAEPALVETSEILLSNLQVATKGGQSGACAGVTIPVTNLSIANDAKQAELLAEIAALQALVDDIEINEDELLADDFAALTESKADIQTAIDNLSAWVGEQADATLLTAESVLPDNTVVSDAEALAAALVVAKAAKELSDMKDAFEAYKAEQVAAVEAMAKVTDSEASQKIIADAKTAIEALEYDEAKTLEENKAAVDEAVAPVADALAAQRAIDLAANTAAFEAYKAEQTAAVEALAKEGDSEASQKIISDAKAAIEALEYDEAKTLDENKAAVDEIAAPVADALDAQRAAELLAANKAAFEAYKAEQTAAVEALAEDGDSEASQKIIADAKAAIEALEYDETKSLDENKAAVDAVVAPVAAALDAQRAADQLAADKAAFEAYKAEQTAAVDALAEDGDSEASQKIITDAKDAIEALEYDESKSLDENKAAVDAIVAPIAAALDAQRAADQLAADKVAFEAYKAEQTAAVEALAEDGDSEASQKIIGDAKAAIEALEYDEAKTLDENKAAVDAVVAPVAATLDAQRAADQLAADKAAFEAYKAEQTAAVEAMSKDTDSEASQKIIADAKAAIEALEYDDAKTLDENKAAVDAVVAPVAAALDAQRAAEQLAADKAAFEAYKATATAAADQLAVDGDSEASQALIVAAKAAIEALEYNENESLEENIEAVDAILADLEESLDEQRGEDNDTAYAALSAELDELDEAIADAKDVLSDSKYALVRDEYLAQLDALQEKVDAAREDLESRNGKLTLSSTNIESITLADVAAVLAAADAAQVNVPGDLNNDGEISMDDFDLFVDELLDNDELWDAADVPELYEEYKKYDVNGDGRIDVADAQALINLALGLNIDGTMPNYVRQVYGVNEGAAQTLATQSIQMSNGATRYILNLNRIGEYASFQMMISGNVVNMSSSNASLRTKRTADGCRVLGFANGNVFNDSELFVVDVIGEAQFSNITLATTNATSVTISQAVATGIANMSVSSESEARYDLSGKQLNAPMKGVNIVRNANGTVRKVMVK